MKKALLVIFCFSVFFLFWALKPQSTPLSQGCVGDYQSCDISNPCCNFPQFVCQEGYCRPQTTLCGVYPYPCCDSPNPLCASGFVCQDGYCQTETEPPSDPDPSSQCRFYRSPSGVTLPCEGEFSFACNNNMCCSSIEGCDSYGGIAEETPPPPDSGGGDQPSGQIPTAIGMVNVNSPSDFIVWVLRFALGIGGGIAFLLMLIGSFQIITSAGNPSKIQAGKELITSALTGLLMIIFSVFLLKLIGRDILNIPQFGSSPPPAGSGGGGGGGGSGTQ